MSDQQMRIGPTQYPVDRYLVESSKKIEMVNIIDDDLWNPEPALRPEDEIVLRKLHDMLQSTADDLKLLSGELKQIHETGVQVKTTPTPLDEEFNEKVHIEELVNAKFHGLKIIDKPESKPQNNVVEEMKKVVDSSVKSKIKNSSVQVDVEPTVKRPVINRNLGISRTKVLHISGKSQDNVKGETLNNGKVMGTPAVAYNEFSFQYVEPKVKNVPQKYFQVQEMPSINIRSELKEQKVLQLDIVSEEKTRKELTTKGNVVVVAVEHETKPKQIPCKSKSSVVSQPIVYSSNAKPIPKRKVTKISTCESSGSTNNVSSDTQYKIEIQKSKVIRASPKFSARCARSGQRIETEHRPQSNLEEWKRKLNAVYRSTSAKKTKAAKSNLKKISPKKSNVSPKKPSTLNNAEYIPYSQLTLGGVRVSDIEQEISELPNKNNIPLSPILDRILSSRENSFSKGSPRKPDKSNCSKILTTSDENLLHEVLDIEKTISETISKNVKKKENGTTDKAQNVSINDDVDNESYVDDFEDEKSEKTERSVDKTQDSDTQIDCNISDQSDNVESDLNVSNNVSNYDDDIIPKPSTSKNLHNTTYTKSSNLSFKDSVDVFEFVHSVDTQETSTQSNTTHKMSLKETQTSPRNEKPNIQPIHNDLWPSIDPKGEVEKLFKLEKEFIMKLIMDEYGDVLQKNIDKPSTSKDNLIDNIKNVTATQKNTQTSPAHVKSVMTSPTKMKTRTTSPFTLAVPVDRETSPLILVTNEEQVQVETENEPDDLAISINLSSPRFSLRLPQNSREVISNLRSRQNSVKSDRIMPKNFRKTTISSSSSADADNSSSELSSLGEVRFKRRFKRRVQALSDCSSSSNISNSLLSCGILPLRSEGELSLGQTNLKMKELPNKSEGET